MRVIVLSKSEFFIEALKLILAKKHIKFDVARNKSDLEALLNENEYDFVVCDLHCNEDIMCIKDIIKRRNSNADIVIMSFNDVDAEAVSGVNFIKRPINHNEIRKTIRRDDENMLKMS